MKYCLRYTNICTKLNKADEITIKYIEDKGLVDFLEKFSSQRIKLLVNPMVFSEMEVRKLIAIRKTYPHYDFAVAMTSYDPVLGILLAKADIKYYEAAPCLNWERFNYLVKEGVSDINLSGPLAFETWNVHRVLISFNANIQIRVTPNKVVNLEKDTDPLVGFYIRPEDMPLYEDVVDVIEFEGLEHQDTFYSIYAEQQMFIGNLNQCIYGFNKPIDNKGLVSLFGERRKTCGRECLKGGRCHRCYDLADLAKPMGDRAREKILDTIKAEQEKMTSSEN